MTLLMGMTLPYDEKKYQELLKSKVNVVPGLSMENLYDHLNELEIRHSYDPKEVLLDLKFALMEVLGKIPRPEEQTPEAEGKKEEEKKEASQ